MPFAGYTNHEDCVRHNSKMDNPDAFCAWLRRKIEGGFFERTLGINLLTREKAREVLDTGVSAWKNDATAVILDDHRWIHVWANTIRSGNKLFLTREELHRLHDMVVDEMLARGLDAGVHHKSPLKMEVMNLGQKDISILIKGRKGFLIDDEFISVVGSSVLGREEGDLDLLVKSPRRLDYRSRIAENLPKDIKDVDFVWQPDGANGPYIPVFQLYAVPVENPKMKEPKFRISPLSPIVPPQPSDTKDEETIHELLEDSYYIEPVDGLRAMIHRKEGGVIAFGMDLKEIEIPQEIKEDILSIEDPKTFILDGFITNSRGEPVYLMIDLPWWRESEHISQPTEVRKHFLGKLQEKPHLKINGTKYFPNRREAIEFLAEETGPFLLIPGSSPYPVDGQSDWMVFKARDTTYKLAESSDARIKGLLESGEWEKMKEAERFRLMTQRKAIEVLQPFAQLKTSKKGYAEREVFGVKSVEGLAKELFSVPNKIAVEVKIDGFRGQLHKDGDQARIFTESGHDITKQLPGIGADVKKIPAKSFVVDAEATPYDDQMQNLGRPGAVHAFTKNPKAPVDDSLWGLHVFDILYLDGRDLHDLPYEERRRILHGLELPIRESPKNKGDFREHLWENNIYWATSAEQMVDFSKKCTDVPGSEGAMFKQFDSKYRLTGTTPLWSKMKAQYELDVLVVGSIRKDDIINYIGAIGPVTGITDQNIVDAPIQNTKANYIRWRGKVYAVLGKTFNTKIEAPEGGIIRVMIKDINKINDKLYHWFQPKVLEYREDKSAPDLLGAAEMIYKAATAKQSHGMVFDEKGVAYLVRARYEGESPLVCCEAPWLAIPGNPWTYLPNTAESKQKLKDLGIRTITGTAMTHDLMDEWATAGFGFSLQSAETINALAGVTDFEDLDPPETAAIDPKELRSFYASVSDEANYDYMKLQCGAIVPLKEKKLQGDPYLTYPDESKDWKYVVQFHVRGLSVHGDLRLQIGPDTLVGWTLDLGKSLIRPMLRHTSESILTKAGITKSDIQALKIAELSSKLEQNADGKKLKESLSKKTQDLTIPQFKTLLNELWKEEVEPIINDPNRKIYTQTKGSMSVAWLKMEGEVPAGTVGGTSELEGQIIIMDRGTVEHGTQKSYFHEYWLHGERANGRIVIRRLATRPQWKTKESFAWLTFFTKKEERPYVISRRAVNRKWYPPKGISALPKETRVQIPEEYHYWTSKNANATRDALVDKIGHGVALKLAAGLQFSVKRVWHKGPEVQRGLPVTRYWILIHDGKKVMDAWDFGVDNDPLAETGITARRKSGDGFSDLLKVNGDIPADHPASMTKKLINHFDTSDSGTARIIKDTNSLLQIRLNGKTLKGVYVFVKEDPGSDMWIFDRAEIKQTDRSLLLGIKQDIKTALYLVPSHGKMLWEGTKHAIVKSLNLHEHIEEPLHLIEDSICYGILKILPGREISLDEFRDLEPEHRITEEERKKWWPDKTKLYFYDVDWLTKFPEPLPVEIKVQGAQVFINRENYILEEPVNLSAQICSADLELIGLIHLGADEDMKTEQRGDLLVISGPAIKPGEVIPMDGRPTYFTKEGIKKFWPSMLKQPIVVLHGPLKGDVVGFVNKRHFDEETGWGWIDEAVIWHPVGIQLILSKELSAFSIEVLPETVWDPEHQHEHVVGGRCVGLSVVPKGACVTCNPITARTAAIRPGDKVYKFGLSLSDYLRHLYWESDLSTAEISKLEGIPRSTIENWMNDAKIPRRELNEARHLRTMKEKQILKLGGRFKITALGTGAFTQIPRDNCPQCEEARKGGKSRRNGTATLFSIGNEHLLINTPKGISEMLAQKHIKPRFVLLDHIHEDAVGGLHELAPMKPIVFTTKEIWEYIRSHIRAISKQDKPFEEIYNFERRILPSLKTIKLGNFVIKPLIILHSSKGQPDTMAYLIKLDDRLILNVTDIYDLPGKEKILKDVDIYIGDGATLTRDIGEQHRSIESQIEWLKDAGVSRAFFTQIGHVGKTQEDLNKWLQDRMPNAQAFYDGAEIYLGGSNPSAVFPEKLARRIISGEIKIVVRTKPYSEYCKQAIYLVGEEGEVRNIFGLYVEGFPEGPISADKVKTEMKVEHGLNDAEWKKMIGDAKEVWIYRPRVLRHYEEPKAVKKTDISGPYLHDTSILPNLLPVNLNMRNTIYQKSSST